MGAAPGRVFRLCLDPGTRLGPSRDPATGAPAGWQWPARCRRRRPRHGGRAHGRKKPGGHPNIFLRPTPALPPACPGADHRPGGRLWLRARHPRRRPALRCLAQQEPTGPSVPGLFGRQLAGPGRQLGATGTCRVVRPADRPDQQRRPGRGRPRAWGIQPGRPQQVAAPVCTQPVWIG